MTRKKEFLAFDLGAESGRAIVGEFDGSRLSLHEVHRFSNIPVQLPDGLHWDALRLWTDIQDGLAMAVKKESRTIASIGIDTWGVDFGLLDQKGHLIANPFHYRDNRTDGMIGEAFNRLSREKIFSLTGIQFMQLNTLYQLLSMVKGDSPLLPIAKTFLTMPDLFNYWLTGEKACEFSIATTTQCFNPLLGSWSEPLLHAMGIPAQIFPAIIPSASVLGPITTWISDLYNCGKITVVAPACHDTGSAVAAVPASGENIAWISSGTWSIMGINLPQPVINDQSLAFNFTNEGALGGSYRFSKNLLGLWLVQECRRTWAGSGNEFSYATLTEMAASAPHHLSIIDPDYDEFLKPGDMPARIRHYCAVTHQAVPQTEGAIIRIALEGLANKYRWVLERLEELSGRTIETVHIIGGGTQNQLLSQFTADATNRTVITGPIEATAIGNILAQGMALGEINSLDEAREIVRNSFEPLVFQPRDRSGWDEAYMKLQELMKND